MLLENTFGERVIGKDRSDGRVGRMIEHVLCHHSTRVLLELYVNYRRLRNPARVFRGNVCGIGSLLVTLLNRIDVMTVLWSLDRLFECMLAMTTNVQSVTQAVHLRSKHPNPVQHEGLCSGVIFIIVPTR